MTKPATPRHERSIFICSRREASRLLVFTSTGQQIRHLISIADPDERRPPGYDRPPHRLCLAFYDATEHDVDADVPQADDVSAIIDFARAAGRSDGDVLIHCTAGISRSTAAGLIVFATWLGEGQETEAVEHLFSLCPHAYPNTLMILLADNLLGLNGALVAALQKKRPA